MASLTQAINLSSHHPSGIAGRTVVANKLATKQVEVCVIDRLQQITISHFFIRPPGTMVDAVDYFQQLSRDYNEANAAPEQWGISFVLKAAHKRLSDELSERRVTGGPILAVALRRAARLSNHSSHVQCV